VGPRGLEDFTLSFYGSGTGDNLCANSSWQMFQKLLLLQSLLITLAGPEKLSGSSTLKSKIQQTSTSIKIYYADTY